VPTWDSTGKLVKDINNLDFRQIFLVNFPDRNANGIADPIEAGAVMSAASFIPTSVAPDSWTSFFGANLAPALLTPTTTTLPSTLGGVTVDVTDNAGVKRPALLQFVSPQQINFLMPSGTAAGDATVTVSTPDFHTASATAQITTVSPGLFSANSNGQGVAAGVALRIDAQGKQTSQIVFRCTGGAGACVSTPIDLGAATDQVILLLYGTGFRGFKSKVTAKIGGQTADVLGAAAQSQFPGLDQVNLRVPPALAGKGEVPIELTVDGKRANTVTVNIR
jgi:uncharacterized protein (TIGR03437 family)